MWEDEMKVSRYAAPTLEPITVEELKLHLKIELDVLDEDEYLETLITTVREMVEDITRRTILTQTWDYYLDEWPSSDFIELPFGNLQSVSSVKYKDTDGTETTLTLTTDYLVETNGEWFGMVVLPYGVSWPSGSLYPSNPITIRFVCGWTTQALVPSRIKAAVKMICADVYEHRGDRITGMNVTENEFYQSLLASLRLWGNF